MSKCGACGAELRWGITVNGKRMPVDAEAAENGNVRLVTGAGPEPEATVIGSPRIREELREAGVPLYTSHHFTCPEGARFRR